jgi:hypothetical protein
MQAVATARSSLPVNPKVASGSGAMSDIVEAMDIDGQLYVSGHNLPQFLERAMERGAEIERARIVAWLRESIGTLIGNWIAIQIEECDHLKEELK